MKLLFLILISGIHFVCLAFGWRKLLLSNSEKAPVDLGTLLKDELAFQVLSAAM